MVRHFINTMREWLKPENDTAIVDWLVQSYELAAVTESGFNQELLPTIKTLEYVKNNFSPEVFQKTLQFPTLYNEIVNVALCFNAGYSNEEVTYFANNGHIECGYVPHFEDEHASFTIVNITEPKNSMAVFIHMSDEQIKLSLQSARKSCRESGLDLITVLKQGFRLMPQRLYIIESDDLKTAFRMAAENTQCIKGQFEYDTAEGILKPIIPQQDETLSAAENQTM